MALSSWLAIERGVFDLHNIRIRFLEVNGKFGTRFLNARPVACGTSKVLGCFAFVRRIFSALVISASPLTSSGRHPSDAEGRSTSNLSQSSARGDAESHFDMVQPPTTNMGMGMQRRYTGDSSVSTVDVPPIELKGVERFKYIVNGIIIANRIRRVEGGAPIPPSPETLKRATRRITEVSDIAPTVPRAKVNALVPKLKNLVVTTQLDAHNALVKDIQFSPDGKLLATARSVDRCR